MDSGKDLSLPSTQTNPEAGLPSSHPSITSGGVCPFGYGKDKDAPSTASDNSAKPTGVCPLGHK